MRRRPVLHAALLALLAAATFVAGTAGPLHEAEAFIGHEHCADGNGSAKIGHICHDEDDCTVCGLLALPTIHEAGSPPAVSSEAAVTAAATPTECVVAASFFAVAPARAPPVL